MEDERVALFEVNLRSGALKGSIYDSKNYDEGAGFYHFNREHILTNWDGNQVNGMIFTTLGREPEPEKEPTPATEKPIAVFSDNSTPGNRAAFDTSKSLPGLSDEVEITTPHRINLTDILEDK